MPAIKLQSLSVVLMALLLGQLDSTAQSEQSGELLTRPRSEAPVRLAETDQASFAPVVKKAAPAVVRIVTTFNGGRDANLAGRIQDPDHLLEQLLRPRRSLQVGLGSGVIVTEDGFILTNGHLVNRANEIEVTLLDGREFKARVIGLDTVTDIAVVKIAVHELPTVPLANSRCVRVGDVVLAIGHPFAVGQTVTHGIVSATDRGGMGIENYESFIQTDAPINPGNSGGALIDMNGRLIGINTAIVSSSGANAGIGFAVPSDLARRVMTDLVKYGHVVRGYLGVETQDLTPELAREFKLDHTAGVLVGAVVPNGPAGKAGIEVGDVVTRFEGKDVRDSRQLKLWVAEIKPGQTVAVDLVREGSAQPLQVTISEASRNNFLVESNDPDPGALSGVLVGELNSELRQQLGVPLDVHGAVVFALQSYSAAGQAGLRPGDVIQSINRQEVANGGDASRLTQSARNKRALLRVWSASGSHFLLVEG